MCRGNIVTQFVAMVTVALLVCGCAADNGTAKKVIVTEEKVSEQPTLSASNFIVPQNATFAWHPNVLSSSPGKAEDTIRVESHVQRAIKESLTGKGYSFVSATASWPDFFIGYVFSADAVVDDNIISKRFDLMPDLRPNPGVTKKYGKGALVIDVIEPTAFRVLWRASTPALVAEGVSEAQQLERIDLKVEDLLSRFPGASG